MFDNLSKNELLKNLKVKSDIFKNEKKLQETGKNKHLNRFILKMKSIGVKKQKIQNCENLTVFEENETKKHNF